MKKSVMVVLSGGQDSVTCLLEAKKRYEIVHAISFDYGQRHRRELVSAIEVAAHVGVDSHQVVPAVGLLRSRGPLLNPRAELETYTDYASMDKVIGNRIEHTFVPLRNPFFLLVAANYALEKGCFTLMTGVCASDNANYPDCTPDFILDMEIMVREALGMHRKDYEGEQFYIDAPLIGLDKAGIVLLAMQHGELAKEALALSHTCYAGEFPPCGKCHSCVLRAEGFKQAGVEDPLVKRGQAHYTSQEAG